VPNAHPAANDDAGADHADPSAALRPETRAVLAGRRDTGKGSVSES
jgi:hypothetical protein